MREWKNELRNKFSLVETYPNGYASFKNIEELESFIEQLLEKQKEEFEKDFIDRAQKVGLAMSKYAILLNKLGLNPKEGE